MYKNKNVQENIYHAPEYLGTWEHFRDIFFTLCGNVQDFLAYKIRKEFMSNTGVNHCPHNLSIDFYINDH